MVFFLIAILGLFGSLLGEKGKRDFQVKANKLPAKAFVLSDLLKYQADAVVSREIVKKDAATVTLFVFDKGQGLSEHMAPFDALVYITDGRAEIEIAGNPCIVKKGEMIILPVNKPHALKAVQKFKMLLIMIRA